ncbi:MAG: hypothetical protein K6F69_05445 [Treponema sp.]|nr:hypothetical protein [Treponema sp.]
MIKRLLCAAALLLSCTFAFSVSYTNNKYQRLAKEYMQKAQRAFDAGQYADAEEYSKKSAENAALSDEYIKMMLAKSDADSQMKIAANKIAWAKKIHAERDFPMAYGLSTEAYANAESVYKEEKYAEASDYAKKAVEALDGVHEIIPLPESYVVCPWESSKDCFWNISGRAYVYNNPLLWENLYQSNKQDLPQPSNPNLIYPGMEMKIPSIAGEYREGQYDPKIKYESFNMNR